MRSILPNVQMYACSTGRSDMALIFRGRGMEKTTNKQGYLEFNPQARRTEKTYLYSEATI